DGTESVLVLGLQFPLSNDQRQLMRLFAEEVVPNIVPHLMPTDHPAIGTTSASAADSAPGDDTFRRPLNFIRRYLDVLLQQLKQASGGPDEQSLRCEATRAARSEEHTSELQSRENLVCRLLLEKRKR